MSIEKQCPEVAERRNCQFSTFYCSIKLPNSDDTVFGRITAYKEGTYLQLEIPHLLPEYSPIRFMADHNVKVLGTEAETDKHLEKMGLRWRKDKERMINTSSLGGPGDFYYTVNFLDEPKRFRKLEHAETPTKATEFIEALEASIPGWEITCLDSKTTPTL